MKNVTSKPELSHPAIESNSHLFDDWFDPIETEVRDRARGFIEELIRGELDAVLARPRYVRSRKADAEGAAGVTGRRHGRPETFADRHFRTDRDGGAARQAERG